MTRTKQQPNSVVKTEPIDMDASLSDTPLDTSQILALLEQNLPAGLVSTTTNVVGEQELHLTPGKATEILLAAGVRPHKKTSEIWEHYKCLNEKQNVECIYCWKVLKRNDSSTKSMWGHMNAYHQDILKEGSTKKKLKRNAALWDMDETPTQPYVKRVRGGTGNHGNSHAASSNHLEQKPSMMDSMAFALQQLQQSGGLGDFNTSFNFLDSLPKTSEIINISSGFGGKSDTTSARDAVDDDDAENQNDTHHTEAGSSSSSGVSASAAGAADDAACRNTETPDACAPATPTSSSSAAANAFDATTSADLAALVSNFASANPMMLAMLNAANSGAASDNNTSTDKSAESPTTDKDPSSFSLSDGPCAAVLMSMALDLDMTMSYHRRRVDIELCFESNRTAEKSGGRGKVICLTDMGKEIKIVERVNGAVSGTELWTKTDFNQFHWAIRGKCQKCFNKP